MLVGRPLLEAVSLENEDAASRRALLHALSEFVECRGNPERYTGEDACRPHGIHKVAGTGKVEHTYGFIPIVTDPEQLAYILVCICEHEDDSVWSDRFFQASRLPQRAGRHCLEDALENAVPGLAVLDLSGVVADCNAAFAALLGSEPAALRGVEAAMLVHPEHRRQARLDLRRLRSGDCASFVAELRMQRADGSSVPLRQSVTVLRDLADGPPEIVIIVEDLTPLKQAERALCASERLASLGRLSASIAHELNNPLESVCNLLFLISSATDFEEMRGYAVQAEREMARVAQIAKQTLRFSRRQSSPAPTYLGEVIDSVLALLQGRLRNRNVSIVKRYSAAQEPAFAYSGELRQVFINLICNALDAMEEKGTLRIDIRPSRNWKEQDLRGVRVTICDSGSGIPRHLLKTIFEPFVSTKEDHGTGLGLWISHEIVTRHGGTLRVRSSMQGPRRGTAMSVFLPTGERTIVPRIAAA